MCVVFLHYISDEKIKTTRDQVTTQSTIPVSNVVLLNSVDSLVLRLLLLNMKCHYYISFIKDCILLLCPSSNACTSHALRVITELLPK